MQQFIYTAKDHTGKVVKAEVEAANVADATKLLISKELFPLNIQPRATSGLQSLSLDSIRRITAKDRVIFTRQLATLVKAGLPIARALSVLTDQIDNPKMLKVAKGISTSVQGGTSLSQSLSRYPDVFNTVFISMVEAGEASGNLDETLLRLASQEEKQATLMAKIRGAFTYPVVVFAVLIGVMILMITMVLPQVGQMYVDLKKPLPFMTKILLGLAAVFTKFWYLFILAAVFAAYAIRVYLKTPDGQSKFDRFKLNMPVFDTLIKKMYMARFTRTLGSLVASGVPILQALEISSKSMNNVHLQKAIKEVATKVKAGTAMSVPLSDHPLFLPLVGQMISVGEQTGTIGDSLEKVANYYEEEVDQAVKNISTLIEPATMVLLGGMVAFLIGSVLLPIYGLVSAIR